MAKRKIKRKGVASAPTKTKAKAKVKKEAKKLSPRISYISSQLDDIERQYGMIASTGHSRDRQSTGLLTQDLLWGGGFAPGMYGIAGKEKAGKSTLVLTCFGASLKNEDIPFRAYFDAEGAILDSPEYARKILRGHGINIGDILEPDQHGVKRARLYSEAVIENFYGYLRKILRIMPYKFYDAKHEQWLYKFDNTKIGKRVMAEMKMTPNKALSKFYDGQVCEAEYAGLEGMVFIDSYAAMVTEENDEAEVRGKRRAQEASAFSEQIKLVVAPLTKKGVAIFGTNQLRINPQAGYGAPPEYEPGGEALKFYSNVREMLRSNAPSSVPGPWKKSTEKGRSHMLVEESVEWPGRSDYYHFSAQTNIKNKYSTPYRNTWIRIWAQDGKGEGRGICPVYDAYRFLEMTNQVERRGEQLKIALGPFAKKTINWQAFKTHILAHTLRRRDLLDKTTKAFGDFNLRKELAKQVRKGTAQELLVSSSGSFDDDDDDLEDDED